MSKLIAALFACVVYAAIGCAGALAGSRVALVIGNGDYPTAALANPVRDATDVAEMLTRLGFTVTVLKNARIEAFDRAFEEFRDVAKGADTALVYYAGHGMQFEDQNWLMPIDTNVASEAQFRRSNISMQTWLRDLDGLARTTLVFLDACRENLLARRFYEARRATGRSFVEARGLGRTVSAGTNALVVYATEPDAVAADGTGSNSPFTAAFLKHAPSPGVEIETLMKRVSATVVAETNGKQRPERLSRLNVEFYLVPASPAGEAPAPSQPPPAAPVPPATFALTVCNSKDQTLHFAFSDRERIRGWWPIKPKSCRKVEDVRTGEVFVYAQTFGTNPVRVFVNPGPLTKLCIEEKSFNIPFKSACAASGKRDFSPVSVHVAEWTWSL